MRAKLQPKTVTNKPGKDMQVYVEHFLPGCFSIRQEQVHTLTLDR